MARPGGSRAATGRDRPSGAPRVPAGLPARLVAAALIGHVVDDRASLEVLTDEARGLPAFLALDPRDRALARAIAVTALRHRGVISAAILRLAERAPPRRARHLLNALHAAGAQILFMDTPDSAAVDLAVASISAEPASARFAGFANAILRRMAREKENLLATLPPTPAHAFPEWLARRIVSDHGRAKASAIAAMLGREPALDLTVHPRLDAPARARLAAELGATVLETGSLRLIDPGPVDALPGFAEGLWWIQDTAASLPARLLGDVGGKRVADLCAAPGGKSAQLAAAGARVTAVDISAARLERLSRNLARLNLEAEIVAADILDWRPDRPFDAILLDAPCSATGTMRRHPDIAWNKTPEDVAALAALQMRMVGAAAAMLAPGGLLVYANCSIVKSEGEDLYASLASGNEFGFVPHPVSAAEAGLPAGWINGQGALRTLPCDLPAEPARAGGLDGFFAARLRRQG